MDDTTPPIPSSDAVTDELSHITQEIYKKNTDLAQSNKTLSLLRKIDEIVLSTMTDPQGIAQAVADLTATETGYKEVSIFLENKDKNILQRLAISQTDGIKQIEQFFTFKFIDLPIAIDDNENLVARAYREKRVHVSHDISDVLGKSISKDKAHQIQEMLSIITITIYPIIIRGVSIGVITLSIDISENNLNNYQHDLRERLPNVIGVAMDNALLYREIQQANEKLKALDKLKDEFVSLASHELRTPMTAIKSYLWMALAGKGGPLSEKQKYYLDRAYNSTDRLIKLVNEMLNVSRIESGRITIEPKPIDINALSDDVVADIAPRAIELGIHLEVVHDTTLPLVLADADKVKEVLINLIGNALKFTPKDGSIFIRFKKSETMVEVQVSDTGKGIDTADVPKLFQKFGKIDTDYLTVQNVQGTGLGLYISKAIIGLHGGTMGVTSDGVGKGSTFYFTLKIENNNGYNTSSVAI